MPRKRKNGEVLATVAGWGQAHSSPGAPYWCHCHWRLRGDPIFHVRCPPLPFPTLSTAAAAYLLYKRLTLLLLHAVQTTPKDSGLPACIAWAQTLVQGESMQREAAGELVIICWVEAQWIPRTMAMILQAEEESSNSSETAASFSPYFCEEAVAGDQRGNSRAERGLSTGRLNMLGERKIREGRSPSGSNNHATMKQSRAFKQLQRQQTPRMPALMPRTKWRARWRKRRMPTRGLWPSPCL